MVRAAVVEAVVDGGIDPLVLGARQGPVHRPSMAAEWKGRRRVVARETVGEEDRFRGRAWWWRRRWRFSHPSLPSSTAVAVVSFGNNVGGRKHQAALVAVD